MRVFEFHFNPQKKTDFIFDSFCSAPENIYEKRMGGLFMLGEIKNPLPHNYKLLEKIASPIKKEFYSKFQRTHEQALKEALKRGNELLAGEVAKENTDWLGNLNFAIISLKNFELNFTKVGAIKMFLMRGPHIIDIGSKLDSQEIEPYPLKVFNNIVSGKVGENDIILAISEGIFAELKGIINEISKIIPFDERKLRILLKTKEKELSDASGAFILVSIARGEKDGKNPKAIFQKEPEKFQIKQALLPLSGYSKKTAAFLKKLPGFWTSILKRKQKEPDPVTEQNIPTGPIKLKVKIQDKKQKAKLPDFKMPKLKVNFKIPSFNFKLPSFKFPQKPNFNFSFIKTGQLSKKRLILILIFIVFLGAGFLIFQGQERQKQKEYLMAIEKIQEKVSQAENFMVLKDSSPEAKSQALSLLSGAWSEIIPMTKLEGSAKKEAVLLKEKIDGDLKNLNNLIKIEEPELVFEFNKDVFIPQKMIYDEKNLYFFSPYVQNIFALDEDKNGGLIQKNQKFNEASEVSDNYVLLFSKPDKITPVENSQAGETVSLGSPYSGFNFTDFTSFKESLYFFDSDSGEIVKYSLPLSESKDSPEKWFWSKSAQKPVAGKSLAVDGSVWILSKDNNLLRYYGGQLQQTITPDVFPAPQSLSKIVIPFGSSYVFISEPGQRRLIILDKDGKIFKQFESEKFNALLDFAVSRDNKTIFLLNGLKVYKINL
jgi:hypothetical protein